MAERHTTVHLREHPPARGNVVGQAHTTEALFSTDQDIREEGALHALEQAVLPHLIALARDWAAVAEHAADLAGEWAERYLEVSLTSYLIDNSEVPGVEDQVTIQAEVTG